MKSIKFSEDYQKLPLNWEGTHAVLIGVYPTKTSIIKNRYTAFWKYDVRFRNKEGGYEFNFEDALILMFIHLNSGLPFTTIRRNYEQKYEYYVNSIGETFKLEKTTQ